MQTNERSIKKDLKKKSFCKIFFLFTGIQIRERRVIKLFIREHLTKYKVQVAFMIHNDHQ